MCVVSACETPASGLRGVSRLGDAGRELGLLGSGSFISSREVTNAEEAITLIVPPAPGVRAWGERVGEGGGVPGAVRRTFIVSARRE